MSELALLSVDQIKLFNLYCFFGGDIKRTAKAASLDENIVEAFAHDFSWSVKLNGRNRLDTPEGLKAEQESNRAQNYYFAQKVMGMISAVVLEATENPEKWAEMNCVDTDEDGNKTFSPKPLVEIAKAVQIAQDMTYRALGDKIAAKADTSEAVNDVPTNLAVTIYAGLQKLGNAVKSVDKHIDILPAARNVTDTDNGVISTAE